MHRALALALLILALAACSRHEEQGSPPFATTHARNPYLALVPANTPYFLVTEERLPREVALAHLARSDFDRQSWLAELQTAAERGPEEERASRRMLARFLELLPARLDEAGLAELGLRPDPHFAFYGVGLLPVLRFELGDSARFLAFLDRVWQTFELQPERAERHGRQWLRLPASPLVFHLTVGDDLHLALAPTGAAEAELARLLGETLPPRSLADAPLLAELKARHGFLPFQLGQLSSAGLLEALKEAASFAQGEQAGALVAKPECAQELAALSQRFPGFELGLREITDDRLHAAFVFLLEPSLAGAITRLAPSLPPLADTSLAEVAFGLRLGELPALLSSWGQALAEAPYRCDALLPLNALAATFKGGAANPGLGLAAMAGEGVAIRLERLRLGRASPSSEPPLEFEATVLLLSNHAQGLLALAQGFAPDLAALGLVAGGEAKPLPIRMFKDVPIQRGFAALGERALAFGLNHADGRRVQAAVKVPVQSDGSIMRFAWRGDLLLMIAQAMEQPGFEGAEEQTLRQQLRDLARDVERMSFDLKTKPTGIEFSITARYTRAPTAEDL